jgi:hypothetical protein
VGVEARTFLALTGYEQVRSIAAELTGDHEGAARVELTLPDTGACGGSRLFDEPVRVTSDGCCARGGQGSGLGTWNSPGEQQGQGGAVVGVAAVGGVHRAPVA